MSPAGVDAVEHRRTRFRVRACAKINLSLRVLGIRPDGYHELRTIFQSIALHDTLTFTRQPRSRRGDSEGIKIDSDDPACPTDANNLVSRAADRLWRAAGHDGSPWGISVRIAKRIPMQAGLGGGSSDAAAALRALSRLWRVDAARLPDVAAELGADVPFFLEGGRVLGLGRGDILFPLIDERPSWVVLVLPDFGVSTQDAYAWRDSSPARERLFQDRELGNDLQPPVADRHPEINRSVQALHRAGAFHSAMSGSGSAVFGLFESRTTAERAAIGLLSRRRRTLVTRMLGRAKYGEFSRPVSC